MINGNRRYVSQFTDAEGRLVQIISEEEPIFIDEASATVTYVGYAKLDTATNETGWKIKRISVTGTITQISYANKKETYENIWDDRAVLSY